MKYERYPGELSHSGVKGMKWGVRKQRNVAGDMAWKKHREKYTKSKSQTTAKKIAKLALLSPSGMYSYNSSRANGDDRFMAGAKAVGSNYMGSIVGGMAGAAIGSITGSKSVALGAGTVGAILGNVSMSKYESNRWKMKNGYIK